MRMNMKIKEKIKKLKAALQLSDAENELSRRELEFLPSALEIVETPPSPVGRATMWLLVGIVTIAVIWACIGKIDEVAVAPGKVIPSGYTKTIQAEDKGVIKKIHVKDGSKVKPGDLLIELDTVFTAADMGRLMKEQAYYQLEIKRLIAEQTGQPFAPEQDPNVSAQDLLYQLQLYQSRTAEYQAKLAVARHAVNQAKSALDTVQATKQKYALQLEIAITKEEKMKELAETGAIAQFQYLDYQEKRIIIQQDLAAQTMEIAKAQQAVLQSMEAMNNVVSERNRDIIAKMVEDRRQLQSVEEELKKAKEKHRLSTIIAPVAGTVHQLAVHTLGAVVTAAQVLMLIVPEGAQMEIEAWVPNKDIGFVYVGQDAEIKVETFNFQKYGTLDAIVVELSSDAVEDKERGLVYRAVLKTKQDYFALANDKKVNIAPGMAATAEIKTRQKRIIEYFMDPFIKYRSEGLRER
jgi:hemolysin D